MGLLSMNVRIAFAAIGIFVGVTVCLCFAFQFKNINASIWGLVSGVFASVTLWVHLRKKRETIRLLQPSLSSIMLTGCFVQLAGVCAFVTYISLAAVFGQGLSHTEIYGENFWIASVWGFMTWKWGFALFWFTREYKRELEGYYVSFENDNNVGPNRKASSGDSVLAHGANPGSYNTHIA